MPRIFDNIQQQLLPSLIRSLEKATHADFCVGYFNLRGWNHLAPYVESFQGNEQCCHLLIGMQAQPHESISKLYGFMDNSSDIDQSKINPLKKQFAEEFREQLTLGAPSNADQRTLRTLATQLKSNKLIIKLFLRYSLHAKLYLLFRNDHDNPVTGYLGSSNLTLSGLSKQGELNIDVLDHDACEKLAQWFTERWNDKFCVDISKELIEIIEQSWVSERLILPYHIYLKMVYCLSQEARAGLEQYAIPPIFGKQLFEYQVEAVKIATHRLEKRGGVIIGDVVGLGKTLIASAIIKLFEDRGLLSLIICPKNLHSLWEDHCNRYELHAHIIPLSQVTQLEKLRRFRLVVIDESHNLRNRDGKRYQIIRNYLHENESKVLLLSATPYNKNYLDLANQLRLFIDPESNIGIRPEQLLLRECNNDPKVFQKRFQCNLHSLAAFEHSSYPDDWRELMRLYMLRRTRSFIQQYYAKTNAEGRKYLLFSTGQPAYFPTRQPKTINFGGNQADIYTHLYAAEVVESINQLHLPRYGLARYILENPARQPTEEQQKLLANLSKADQRLRGFCRTNLFKRLESSIQAFYLSVERHILRNQVYLYALENQLPIPIGTQDAAFLDVIDYDIELADNVEEQETLENQDIISDFPPTQFEQRARKLYQFYTDHAQQRFQWLPSDLLKLNLATELKEDIHTLIILLNKMRDWSATQDSKFQKLRELLTVTHPHDKILIFTQFADTAHYLHKHLQPHVSQLDLVTGTTDNPTNLVQRFSPISNNKSFLKNEEIHVLIATDVLSEGQNLQDCAIIVNYDLTWAIIRLIQRAGRVDRIGQQADKILCYSFLPAEGIEKIIQLRSRLTERLQQNREVLGTDEHFFEDEQYQGSDALRDLYSEKANVLDEPEAEVDLASYAYGIWKNAIMLHPKLENEIMQLPACVHSSKSAVEPLKTGVLVYVRTAQGNDTLAYFNEQGQMVTESQLGILNIAQCTLDTPALPHREQHHDLVKEGVCSILAEEHQIGGQLGKSSGVRYKVYHRLKEYYSQTGDMLLELPALEKAINQLYAYPLHTSAADILKQKLAHKIGIDELGKLVVALYEDNRLCIDSQRERGEATIICSMGIWE